jgi:hypothetical protein
MGLRYDVLANSRQEQSEISTTDEVKRDATV